MEVTLHLRVMMSVSDNYSHYEQMSLAGHLLSIVTLYVTPCDTCIWCNTFVTISVTMTTGHNGSNMGSDDHICSAGQAWQERIPLNVSIQIRNHCCVSKSSNSISTTLCERIVRSDPNITSFDDTGQ